MKIKELISRAEATCNLTIISDEVTVGEVAAALLTKSGNIYTGICIVVPCGMGFCAEHSAIAEMLKNGETEISYIVAVKGKKIIPPCGRCRELMRQINKNNYQNTNVIIADNKAVPLSTLLPLPF